MAQCQHECSYCSSIDADVSALEPTLRQRHILAAVFRAFERSRLCSNAGYKTVNGLMHQNGLQIIACFWEVFGVQTLHVQGHTLCLCPTMLQGTQAAAAYVLLPGITAVYCRPGLPAPHLGKHPGESWQADP